MLSPLGVQKADNDRPHPPTQPRTQDTSSSSASLPDTSPPWALPTFPHTHISLRYPGLGVNSCARPKRLRGALGTEEPGKRVGGRQGKQETSGLGRGGEKTGGHTVPRLTQVL